MWSIYNKSLMVVVWLVVSAKLFCTVNPSPLNSYNKQYKLFYKLIIVFCVIFEINFINICKNNFHCLLVIKIKIKGRHETSCHW